MIWIRYALNAAALIYGGVTDYKRREISNLVPLVLLFTGLLDYETILLRLFCLLVMVLILWLSGKVAKAELPGGDLKLLCALAFSCGILQTVIMLLLTGIASALIAWIRKRPVFRNIPLCSYVAPAYFCVLSIIFVGTRILLAF